MPNVFISYRRLDASHEAFHLHRSLSGKLGEESVFIDIDNIPFGADFRMHINRWVSRAEIVLVVIGNHWLESRDERGELRLQNPADFVRVEIETAFRLNKCVIPVLVGQAVMPSPAALPESLEALAYRNAAEVRVGREYDRQLQRLVEWLVNWKPEEQDERETEIPPVRPPEPKRVAPELEDVITNSIGKKLKLIPAGEFLMGSPDSDTEASSDEKPQHKVRITKPYYLGVYPVTQEQYEAVMQNNPSRFKGNPKCPVERVSWDEAVEFCRRLGEEEGRPYRLPTEAEWEYACRAGTTTKWCCGDEAKELERFAWYDANSGNSTHPVGQKEANAWGLHDMHGNVWEWCEDAWHDSYKGAPTDGSAWSGEGTLRVCRGGGWALHAGGCRCACRYHGEPGLRFGNLGFRLVLAVSVKEDIRPFS